MMESRIEVGGMNILYNLMKSVWKKGNSGITKLFAFLNIGTSRQIYTNNMHQSALSSEVSIILSFNVKMAAESVIIGRWPSVAVAVARIWLQPSASHKPVKARSN
jgi:hypothetical protein